MRRKSIDKEAANVALEEDLDRLKNAKQVTDEEFNERLLDFLQDGFPEGPEGWCDWREGICTRPRNPDGTLDRELWDEIWEAAR